jgi:hypothetical protein
MARETKAKRPKETGSKVPTSVPDNALKVATKDGEGEHTATARALIGPSFRHGQAAAQLLKANLGNIDFAPGIGNYADAIAERVKKAATGDLAFASHMLAAQAMTLDGIFTEMIRRMALNMGEYLGATETYARIALKAQAGSRATLEALAKLHQPREQTVRHVHVNEGGQAVIADQFHHHTGGRENAKSADQPHATGAAQSGERAALPSPHPIGQAVPIASGEGEGAVQNARRQRQRRA